MEQALAMQSFCDRDSNSMIQGPDLDASALFKFCLTPGGKAGAHEKHVLVKCAGLPDFLDIFDKLPIVRRIDGGEYFAGNAFGVH